MTKKYFYEILLGFFDWWVSPIIFVGHVREGETALETLKKDKNVEQIRLNGGEHNKDTMP